MASFSISTEGNIEGLINENTHCCLLLTTLIVSTGLAQESGGGTSAEDAARDLANPNTPLASLKFKLQYRTFKGDLPNAGRWIV